MNLLLALIALAMIGEINIVGRMTGGEVILAVCAVVALIRCPRPPGHVARFYIFALLWLIGAVLSDIVSLSDFNDLSRGWAKIGFFVMNFTALRWLLGQSRGRTVLFIFLLMIANAARLALGVGGDDQIDLGKDVFGNGWKFGYGQLVSASALLVSAWLMPSRLTRPLALALPFGAAATALLLNARNLTGVTALAALASLLTAGRRRPLSMSRLLAIGAATALAGLLILNVYQYTAQEGLLGSEAQDKYLAQTQSNLGLFQGGRTESLASIQAIIDSPILGHGSWARDIRYVYLMLQRMADAGVTIQGKITDDLIPSHSHLLGAWVEHGILGAMFWIWALTLTVTGLISAVRTPSPLTGFTTFIGLALLWDIVFSPLGLTGRVTDAAALYLIILVVEQPAVASPVPSKQPPGRLPSLRARP